MEQSDLYQQHYNEWKQDPEGYWDRQAQKITWHQKYTQVLDSSNPPMYRWFNGGMLNTCFNCVDRHVENGKGLSNALIWDSAMTKEVIKLNYLELLNKVKHFSSILRSNFGIEKGDRIVVYMPMIPEALIGILASSRVGAIHSVVFGGFAVKELASRIIDADPKLILSANIGIEPHKKVDFKAIIDEALNIAKGKVTHNIKVVFKNRPQGEKASGNDYFDFDELTPQAVNDQPEWVESSHPSYILYTSGTTGQPKGIVRDTGGHMIGCQWSLEYIFGINEGDIFWATSDIGWVVGHTFNVYGPLLRGATTVWYEGKPVGTPDAGAFWRIASQHKVKSMYSAPTAIRAVKKEDPDGVQIKKYDLSHLQMLGLVGERSDPDTINWCIKNLPNVLINDNYWQTETGWPVCSNFLALTRFQVKPGSCCKPIPGYEIKIVIEATENLESLPEIKVPGQLGKVCWKLPMPPGFMMTLWKNDEAFKTKYLSELEGHYSSGDFGYQDVEGYIHIMGRLDDVINTAGHRLSTGQMEEIIANHPEIAECAVIGVKSEIKGQVPLAFAIMKSGSKIDPKALEKEVILLIRSEIGPVAALQNCIVLEKLPKTRSGKILRSTLRKMVQGDTFTIPPTIESEQVLEDIKLVLKQHNLGTKIAIQFEEDIASSQPEESKKQ